MYIGIDQKAFEFVTLLERKAHEKSDNPQSPLKIGEEEPINLGEVKNMRLVKEDPFGSKIAVFQSIEDELVGFSESLYSQFRQFISDVSEEVPFDSKGTFSFLEVKAFNWLIHVYKSKKASQSLSSYLLDAIDKEYREYIFYFRLRPLILEMPFNIGKAEIGFFTEEFLNEEERKFLILGKSKKDFEDLFSAFKNIALVKVKAHGVRERAAEIALQEGEIVADILKCLLHELTVYDQYIIPEIDHRFTTRMPSSFLFNYPADKFCFEISISNHGGVIPVEINKEKLGEFKKNKLDQFASFITNKKETEIYYAVLDAIRSFSKISSTANRHERVVKLISFFESILIDKRDKRGMGETILKSGLIPKLLKSEADIKLGGELASYFYRIRDAYIHHGIERPIDFTKLFQFQTIAFRFLHYLIKASNTCNSWDDFYALLKQLQLVQQETPGI